MTPRFTRKQRADRVVAVEQLLNAAIIRESDEIADESDIDPGTASMLSAIAATLAEDSPDLDRLAAMVEYAAKMHADEMLGVVIADIDIERHIG